MLRPYQHKLLDSVWRELVAGKNRLLTQMATGTGKTVAFAQLLQFEPVATWLQQQERRKGATFLVIAHREELIDQATEKVRKQNPGLMVDIEQGDRYASRYSEAIVASVQTLSAMKFRRLKRLLRFHTFNIVVVDEAHHAAANTYRTVLALLGFLPSESVGELEDDIETAKFDDVAVMEQQLAHWDERSPKDRLLLGVTATPNRTDAVGLGCVFQSIAFEYPIKQAIDDGYLVKIRPWAIETSESLDDVRTVGDDFNQGQLANAVNTPRRNRLAIDEWKLHAGDLQTMAFTVDVQHAHDVVAMFKADGVVAEAVSGKTEKNRRRDIVRAYRRGDVQVLANCMVFTEGTDLPMVSCVLHMKPTKSPSLYEQMSGRGLRPHPDDPVGPERLAFAGELRKAECIVLDVVDISRKHSLMQAPVLYGLPPNVLTTGDLLDKTLAELEELRERVPGLDIDELLREGRFSLGELLDRASTFDPFQVQALGAFGKGRAMTWLRSGSDTFAIQYPWKDGVEELKVQKDLLGHWEVVQTITPRDGSPRRHRTMAAAVASSQEAAGLAEAFILQERRSVGRIRSVHAPWRDKPVTIKQLQHLAALGVQGDHRYLSSGEASDKIDLAMLRRGNRRH